MIRGVVLFLLLTAATTTLGLSAFPESIRVVAGQRNVKIASHIREKIMDLFNARPLHVVWNIGLQSAEEAEIMDTVIRKELEEFGYELERGYGGPIHDSTSYGPMLGIPLDYHFAWRAKR